MEAPRLRIGDAERQAAADALAGHYVEGRLDTGEHAERLERIWAARTQGDLAPVFADLPAPAAGARPAPTGAVPAGRAARGHRGPRAVHIVMVLLVLALLLRAPVLLGVAVLAVAFVIARRRRGRGPAGPPRSLRSTM
ncbi:DUF1707 domain-containing protein [Nocardioides sp. dk4132]|uniref:DUF1707 SHOCT-like domain-containing protein n=1 Tax=unclassified Nocardioides TaxID=2615069 RepID=UPI001297A848|nr:MULTISPECIES: DUF1707 domain-containing protein [unclassified Nocardioides]MQW76997.1 DUF1707 domain-containing protein [Nocardioides sp. dk4132]QGA09868.1 DUF1707 domain-containing protein [Nocardioides sp. dk884]